MTDAITAAGASSTSLYTTAHAADASKQTMNQEVFLALLVAQLKYQDPTSPMDTTEMMAQTTQLASMEQLTTLTDTTRESFDLQMRIAAASLVGQQVSVLDAKGVTHTGVASAVSFTGDTPTITVDGVTVGLDSVSAVAQPGSTPAPSGSTPAPSSSAA